MINGFTLLTAKCPCGKKSHGKVSLRRSVLTANCPRGKMSSRRSVHMANCPTAKCPMAKIPTAKSPGAQWTKHWHQVRDYNNHRMGWTLRERVRIWRKGRSRLVAVARQVCQTLSLSHTIKSVFFIESLPIQKKKRANETHKRKLFQNFIQERFFHEMERFFGSIKFPADNFFVNSFCPMKLLAEFLFVHSNEFKSLKCISGKKKKADC